MRIADVLDLNKIPWLPDDWRQKWSKACLALSHARLCADCSLEVEDSSGVTVEQLFMRMLRPTRISRAHETCQISLPDDKFSSDSEDEEDSGDEGI